MLNDLIELKKKRDQQKAEELYQKALTSLSKNLANQVTLYLDKAIEQDKDYVLNLLEKDVEDWFRQQFDTEAACLGYVLLHHRPNNYKLATQLGNSERRLGNYKEAHELYKHALTINKKFELALLNMAAGMARVDLYDDEIPALLKHYLQFDKFLIPDINYFEVPDILDSLFLKFKHEEYCEKVNDLQCSLFSKELKNVEVVERKFAITAKMLKNKYLREAEMLSYTEKVEQLVQKSIEMDWQIFDEKEKNTLGWELYHVVVQAFQNTSIYLGPSDKNQAFLQNTNLTELKKILFKLENESLQLEYVSLLLAIIHYLEGDKNQAINILKDLLTSESGKNNRFYHVNLGLIYYHNNNKLSAFRHLIPGALVLQDLEGYYKLSDIILLAQRKQLEKDYTKALRLYKIVALETDDTRLLQNFGNILIATEHFEEAKEVFQDIQKLDSKNIVANRQLRKLILLLVKKGDTFWQDNLFQEALSFYLKALEINRKDPDILAKAIAVHKRMGQRKEAFMLEQERQTLIAKIKAANLEKERRTLIQKGKLLIQKKKYKGGLEYLNQALLMKPDKQLYLYLVNLYTKLHFKKALLKLEDRWQRIYREEALNLDNTE